MAFSSICLKYKTMKKPIIDSTLEELAKAITEQVLTQLAPILNHHQKDANCNEVFTRKQAIEFLSITYGTLHNYIKSGTLEPVRIPGSGRVYFNRCAVYKLLKAGKGGK